MTTDPADYKKQAATYTVDTFVQSGMILGLGVGSTAIHAIRRLAQRIESGELTDIQAIPCASQVEEEARRLGITLTTLEAYPSIDLTFDGADEVDPAWNLIKGGGGALLREKIVAQATRQEIIMVDESKLVPRLGTNWAVPIEVVSFGWGSQIEFLKSLGGSPHLRKNSDDTIFYTDHRNVIIDCNFGPIDDPERLAQTLKSRTGIVEHGLFLGLAHAVVVAGEAGVRILTKAIGR